MHELIPNNSSERGYPKVPEAEKHLIVPALEFPVIVPEAAKLLIEQASFGDVVCEVPDLYSTARLPWTQTWIWALLLLQESSCC